MEMTIKEMARIAWERDLVVDVKWGNDFGMTGFINSYATSCLVLKGPDGEYESIPYADITSIRFVDEKTMPFSERVQYAIENNYRVRVDYGDIGGVGQGKLYRTEKHSHTFIRDDGIEQGCHYDHAIRDIERIDDACQEEVSQDPNITEWEVQIEAQKNTIEKLIAENAELKRSLSEPVQRESDEEYDIDSERWQTLRKYSVPNIPPWHEDDN
jgi:hypothetical protein